MDNDNKWLSEEDILKVVEVKEKRRLLNLWTGATDGKEKLPTEKALLQIMEAKEKKRLLNMWKTETIEMQVSEKKVNVHHLPIYARYTIAASLALLLSIGIYWSTSVTYSFNNPTELALAYESKFSKPHLDQLKSGTQDMLAVLKKEYADNNFPKTLQLIKELPSELVTDKLIEISGYCHFKTGQYQVAIQDFEKVVNNGNQSLDNALWFLALAHLKLTPPETEKATTYLEQLKPYKTKAKEAELLMEEINQLSSALKR